MLVYDPEAGDFVDDNSNDSSDSSNSNSSNGDTASQDTQSSDASQDTGGGQDQQQQDGGSSSYDYSPPPPPDQSSSDQSSSSSSSSDSWQPDFSGSSDSGSSETGGSSSGDTSWLTDYMSQPGGALSTDYQAPGLELPDPNNQGQFAPWSPAQTGPGLAPSDFAGTAAVPSAQQVAESTGQPVLDQSGRVVMPRGWNPAGAGGRAAGGAGGPPMARGAYTPGPGGGWIFNPNIIVSPNISPVFNIGTPRAPFTEAAPTRHVNFSQPAPVHAPVRSGFGNYADMASGSPDVWYSLEGNGTGADQWGHYPTDPNAQPVGFGTSPWHPFDSQDATLYNTAQDTAFTNAQNQYTSDLSAANAAADQQYQSDLARYRNDYARWQASPTGASMPAGARDPYMTDQPASYYESFGIQPRSSASGQ